eukprot:jgi/Tetstr1/422542/TSEL_013350.t1
MPPPTYAVPLEAAPYELAWHCLAAALARCEARLTPLTRRLAQKLYANAADGWLAGLKSTLGPDAAANLPKDDNTAWDFNTLGQIWKRPQWLAELVLPELGLQQLDDASHQLRHDFDELLFLRSVQAHPYEAGHGDRLPVVGKLIEGVGTAHRLVASLAPMLEPEACNDEVLSGLLDESRSLNGGESGDDAIIIRDPGSMPKLLLQLSVLAVESGLIPVVRALQREAKLPGPEDFPRMKKCKTERKQSDLGNFDNAVGLATYIGYCLPKAARELKNFPVLDDIVRANTHKKTGWPGAHSDMSALDSLKACRALCHHSSSEPPTLDDALLAQQVCDQLLAAFLPADDAIRAVSRRRTAWLHGALQTDLPSDISFEIRKSADTLLPHLASSAERPLLTRKRIIDESCIEASGRQAVLEQLVERLRAEEAPPEARSTVLWGTSGTGKTSLANLAVHKAASGAFTAVLSLQGSSEAALRLGLEAFARSEPRVRVQRDDSADEALTKLGVYLRSHDMWCALVDDVAVEAADIWRYIPEGRGQLLMTATRDLGLPEECAIRLLDLSLESAMRLLVRLVRGKEAEVEAYLQPREEVEALLAGPLVGGLPVMVAEVAAIIGNRSKPFLEVAAELRDAAGSCLEGVNCRNYMLGGPMGSMKLWMRRLAQRRGAGVVRAAERLLAICALLEPTGIPVSLLAEEAVKWDAQEGLGMAGHIAQSLGAEETAHTGKRRLAMERMIEEWKGKVAPQDDEPRRKLIESLSEALTTLVASRSSWEEQQQLQHHDYEGTLEVDVAAGIGQEGDAGREADDLAEVLEAKAVLEERYACAKDAAAPSAEDLVGEGLTEQLAEALTAVEACGNLLESLPGGEALAMHGVFQSCALKLFAGEAAEAAMAVRGALASCYCGNPHVGVKRKKEWLPCAQHFVTMAGSEGDMTGGEDVERLELAKLLSGVGNFLRLRMGDLAGAEGLLERALDIREQQLGPHHPHTASSLNNLASLHKAKGDYAAAQPLMERALDIREQQLGPCHPHTATSLNNLAALHQDKGDYVAAQPLMERALGIWEQRLGPRHPDTATSLNNLAQLHQDKGDYAAAQPLMERALDIREQQLGPCHPDTATSLNNLAQLYKAKGDYAAAQPLMERALDIREQQLGPRHPSTAASLNNLAELHKAKGDYAAAQPLYERALDIREQQLGPHHPDTLSSLNNLAQLHEATQPLALDIWEQQLGPRHPDTATSLNNLAALHQDKGDYVAAQPLYKRALAICAKQLGPRHPDTAASLNNLAILFAEKKDYIAAHPHMERALSIRAERLGLHHPDTLSAAQSLRNMMSWARHDMKDAFALRDMLRRSAEQLMRLGQRGSATDCMQWLKGCSDTPFHSSSDSVAAVTAATCTLLSPLPACPKAMVLTRAEWKNEAGGGPNVNLSPDLLPDEWEVVAEHLDGADGDTWRGILRGVCRAARDGEGRINLCVLASRVELLQWVEEQPFADLEDCDRLVTVAMESGSLSVLKWGVQSRDWQLDLWDICPERNGPAVLPAEEGSANLVDDEEVEDVLRSAKEVEALHCRAAEEGGAFPSDFASQLTDGAGRAMLLEAAELAQHRTPALAVGLPAAAGTCPGTDATVWESAGLERLLPASEGERLQADRVQGGAVEEGQPAAEPTPKRGRTSLGGGLQPGVMAGAAAVEGAIGNIAAPPDARNAEADDGTAAAPGSSNAQGEPAAAATVAGSDVVEATEPEEGEEEMLVPCTLGTDGAGAAGRVTNKDAEAGAWQRREVEASEAASEARSSRPPPVCEPQVAEGGQPPLELLLLETQSESLPTSPMVGAATQDGAQALTGLRWPAGSDDGHEPLELIPTAGSEADDAEAAAQVGRVDLEEAGGEPEPQSATPSMLPAAAPPHLPPPVTPAGKGTPSRGDAPERHHTEMVSPSYSDPLSSCVPATASRGGSTPPGSGSRVGDGNCDVEASEPTEQDALYTCATLTMGTPGFDTAFCIGGLRPAALVEPSLSDGLASLPRPRPPPPPQSAPQSAAQPADIEPAPPGHPGEALAAAFRARHAAPLPVAVGTGGLSGSAAAARLAASLAQRRRAAHHQGGQRPGKRPRGDAYDFPDSQQASELTESGETSAAAGAPAARTPPPTTPPVDAARARGAVTTAKRTPPTAGVGKRHGNSRGHQMVAAVLAGGDRGRSRGRGRGRRRGRGCGQPGGPGAAAAAARRGISVSVAALGPAAGLRPSRVRRRPKRFDEDDREGEQQGEEQEPEDGEGDVREEVAEAEELDPREDTIDKNKGKAQERTPQGGGDSNVSPPVTKPSVTPPTRRAKPGCSKCRWATKGCGSCRGGSSLPAVGQASHTPQRRGRPPRARAEAEAVPAEEEEEEHPAVYPGGSGSKRRRLSSAVLMSQDILSQEEEVFGAAEGGVRLHRRSLAATSFLLTAIAAGKKARRKELQRCRESIDLLGGREVEELPKRNPEEVIVVTHASEREEGPRTTTRKYLLGLGAGCMVVTPAWLHKAAGGLGPGAAEVLHQPRGSRPCCLQPFRLCLAGKPDWEETFKQVLQQAGLQYVRLVTEWRLGEAVDLVLVNPLHLEEHSTAVARAVRHMQRAGAKLVPGDWVLKALQDNALPALEGGEPARAPPPRPGPSPGRPPLVPRAAFAAAPALCGGPQGRQRGRQWQPAAVGW